MPTETSSAVESWLKGRGVEFVGPKRLAISSIDEAKSRQNQARSESIITPVVDRYTAAVRNGDVFPPIVVYKRGERYVIVDGNHRQASHKRAGRELIDAIIIDANTPSETIELLTAEANTKHGESTSADWRAYQAVYLVSLGHDLQTVAHALGISKSSVQKAVSVNKMDNRARTLGVGAKWDKMKYSAKGRINPTTSDPVFLAIIDLAVDTDFAPGPNWSTFISDVKKCTSDVAALELIGTIREEREFEARGRAAIGKGKGAIRSPRHQILTTLGAVMKMDVLNLNRMFITDEERAEIARRLDDAAEKLMEAGAVLSGE